MSEITDEMVLDSLLTWDDRVQEECLLSQGNDGEDSDEKEEENWNENESSISPYQVERIDDSQIRIGNSNVSIQFSRDMLSQWESSLLENPGKSTKLNLLQIIL